MINVKRFLVIFVSVTIAFFLQMVIIPMVPRLIVVPNLLLICVISAGFLYGKAKGLAAGLAAGLLMDILGSGIPGFFTMIFSILGYLDGCFSERYETEIIVVLFAVFILNELVYHLYVFSLAFLIRKSFSLSVYLSEVVLPEVFMSMLCFIVIFGILLFISNRWELRVNKGEIRIV